MHWNSPAAALIAAPKWASWRPTSPMRSHAAISRRRCGRSSSACWASSESPLQPQAEQPDMRPEIVPGDVGDPPFLAVLALELELTRHAVGQRPGRDIAIVLARRSDVIVEATRELERAEQPAPEGVVDLGGDLARERARDSDERRLRDRRRGGQLDGGERARQPDQRGIDGPAADVLQRRVLVDARQIPEGDFSGKLARQLERRPGLAVAALRGAVHAGGVDREVVGPDVGAELDEWLHARRQFVAVAQQSAVLVVIATGVAGGRAVDEDRVVVDRPVEGAFGHDLEPVEALTDPGGAAVGHSHRQPGEIELDVRAAGIVGEQQVAAFELDAGL